MAGVLMIVIGLLVTGLILIACCAPKLFVNLGKSIIKPLRGGKVSADADQKKAEAILKARKNSPEFILKTKIEDLTPGQILSFKINPRWGANFITVEQNLDSAQNTKKYIIDLRDDLSLPDGKKDLLYVTEDISLIAKSILEREGVLYGVRGKEPVSPN